MSARLKRCLVAVMLMGAFIVPMLVSPPIASATGCDNTWLGNNGTDQWSLGANWSTGSIPDSTQDVCIPYVNSHNPHILGGTTLHVKSITESSPATLSIFSSANVTIDNASTFYNLNIEGADVTINGDLTVASDTLLYGGSTISGSGLFTTNGSVSMSQTGTTTLGVNWDANGAVNWGSDDITATGHTITIGGTGAIDSRALTSSTVINTAGLVFDSTNVSHLYHAFVNGPVTVDQNTVYFGNNTVNSLSQSSGVVGLYDPSDGTVGELSVNGSYTGAITAPVVQ